MKNNIDLYLHISKAVSAFLGLIMPDTGDLSEAGLSTGMVKSLCKVIFHKRIVRLCSQTCSWIMVAEVELPEQMVAG